MISMRTKKEKLSNKKRIYAIGVAIIFTLALVLGIKSTYAYYYSEASKSMLAIAVGDFEIGSGDINIMIYKETEKGTNKFARSYSVPAMGYKFDDTQTVCSLANGAKITCTNTTAGASAQEGASNDCQYSYDNESKKFTVTSNQKLTCKFYFTVENESDINVYIMREDKNDSDQTWNGKNYKMVNGIPAYGYTYAGYSCEDGSDSSSEVPNDGNKATVEYDAENKKFKVSTKTKNKCYAYFNSDGESDITTNVYVESAKDSGIYNLVNVIPTNTKYKLADKNKKQSVCYKGNEQTEQAEGISIDYVDGYINIDNIGERINCDIFLDIDDSTGE